MRKRNVAGLFAILVAFVLGFLLAGHSVRPAAAPTCRMAGSSETTKESGIKQSLVRGGGSPGQGSPLKIGADGGGAGSVSGAAGTITGGGAGSPAGGGGKGDGDLAGGGFYSASGNTVSSGAAGTVSGGAEAGDNGTGGGGGHMQPGEAQARVSAPSQSVAGGGNEPPPIENVTPQMADGDAPTLPVPPHAPGDRVAGAHDFTYDRTGLPRYANAVDRVASSMVIPAGATLSDQNTTVAGILTRDTPDTVVTWYQAHLPQGWVEQAPPSEDAEKQARQQVNSHPASDTPVNSLTKAIMAPQLQQLQSSLAQLRALHLTFFWPPDRKTDSRSVLISLDKKTGETYVLLRKDAIRQ